MLASGHGAMYGYHGKIAIRLDKNFNMDRGAVPIASPLTKKLIKTMIIKRAPSE